jgi:hypothetical protein
MTTIPPLLSSESKPALPQHMKYVLGAGAAGGFVSWIYSMIVGPRLPLPMFAAIAACFILGATAALVSVYVVANSDVNNGPRLIAFAVICGIFWKPVLDSSISYVNQKRDVANSQERSDVTLAKLQVTPAASRPAAVAEATDATTDLLKTSDRLKDPELEEKARVKTGELINVISSKGASDPAVAVTALTEIREAASNTGNPQLAAVADNAINRLKPQSQISPTDQHLVDLKAPDYLAQGYLPLTATTSTTSGSVMNTKKH